MGGSIRVQSAPDQGAHFIVELRLPRASAPVVRPTTKVLERIRVLVVDDNRVNREILQQRLEGWHMRVTCAASGEEALRLMASAAACDTAFQLAVLDMHMRNMDGLQLARAIQQQPAIAGTPIVMLTSTHTNAANLARQSAGAVRVINKPVRTADLLRALIDILTGTSPRTNVCAAGRAPGAAKVGGAVLLVEDNMINQQLAKAMLVKLGCQVALANNGKEAVEAVRASDFDLVLMDCQMPVMDGYEATSAIRQLPEGRGAKLPIVALTANAMAGDQQECRDAGMDDFLAKPYSLSAFGTMLQRWLPAAAAAPSSPMAAQAPKEAAAPIINDAAFNALRLRDDSGATDGVPALLRRFLDTAQVQLEQVELAALAGDAKAIGRLAQVLQSSSAGVGAQILSDQYRKLEELARFGDIDEARELLGRARREQARVTAYLKEFLTAAA